MSSCAPQTTPTEDGEAPTAAPSLTPSCASSFPESVNLSAPNLTVAAAACPGSIENTTSADAEQRILLGRPYGEALLDKCEHSKNLNPYSMKGITIEGEIEDQNEETDIDFFVDPYSPICRPRPSVEWAGVTPSKPRVSVEVGKNTLTNPSLHSQSTALSGSSVSITPPALSVNETLPPPVVTYDQITLRTMTPFILLDDDDDDDDDKEKKRYDLRHQKASISSKRSRPCLRYRGVREAAPVSSTGGDTAQDKGFSCEKWLDLLKTPAVVILDDDSDEEEDMAAVKRRRTSKQKKTIPKKSAKDGPKSLAVRKAVDVEALAKDSHESGPKKQPVRDIRHLLFDGNPMQDSSLGRNTPDPLPKTAEEQRIAFYNALHPLFQTEAFSTKKSFQSIIPLCLPPSHILERNTFWPQFLASPPKEALPTANFDAASPSIEFVGEGSFGLVWKATVLIERTQAEEGSPEFSAEEPLMRRVSIKSCPISVSTKLQREDALSNFREVAIMNHLQTLQKAQEHLSSSMEPPVTVPLYSAFFVPDASESIPPLVQKALLWRQACQKRAEAIAMEESSQREWQQPKEVVPFDELVEDILENRLPALEREEEAAAQRYSFHGGCGDGRPSAAEERRRYESIKYPKFISLTQQEALQSDGTLFLVMESCDGDLEKLTRDPLDSASVGTSAGASQHLAASLASSELSCEVGTRDKREADMASTTSAPSSTSHMTSHQSPSGGTSKNEELRASSRQQKSSPHRRQRRRPLSPLLWLPITSCVSRALTHLHALGLVHLDIKPSNILFSVTSKCPAEKTEACSSLPCMFTEKSPFQNVNGQHVRFYVSDFGNCQLLPLPHSALRQPEAPDGPSHTPSTSSIAVGGMPFVTGCIGTFAYMDLRALEHLDVSTATDCFSLGATLWELAFGRKIYTALLQHAASSSQSRGAAVLSSHPASASLCIGSRPPLSPHALREVNSELITSEPIEGRSSSPSPGCNPSATGVLYRGSSTQRFIEFSSPPDEDKDEQKDREWYLGLAKCFTGLLSEEERHRLVSTSVSAMQSAPSSPFRSAVNEEIARGALGLGQGTVLSPDAQRSRLIEFSRQAINLLYDEILKKLLVKEWEGRMSAEECVKKVEEIQQKLWNTTLPSSS